MDPLDAAGRRVAWRRPCPRTALAVDVQVGRMSIMEEPGDACEKKDVLDSSGADCEVSSDLQHSLSALNRQSRTTDQTALNLQEITKA